MIRILLVEDDKNFSFIIQSSLEQMIGGYEVVTASNGKEGLEKLAQATFDVIISDIEMPVLDGITMVQQIREQYPSLLLLSSSDRTYNSFQLNSGYALLLHHNHTRGR